MSAARLFLHGFTTLMALFSEDTKAPSKEFISNTWSCNGTGKCR
jgi:hypothetical protein